MKLFFVLFICDVETRNGHQFIMLTHLCRMDSSTITVRTGLFPSEGILMSFTYTIKLILCFTEIPVFNANSADTDQTPRPNLSTLFATVPFMGH